MIPIRIQRLKPRQQMRVTRGVSKNFELILALLSLDDQTLYQARDMATQIHDPTADREAYQRLKTNIYQKGHRAGLIETNQNLDHRGKPQEPAKWDGFHWKKTINDGDWQRACKFFNALSERAEAHQKLGRSMHFFFDNKIGLIEAPEASPKLVRQQLHQGHGARTPFFENWDITTLERQPVAPKEPAPQASNSPPPDDAPSRPTAWWPWPLLAFVLLLGWGIGFWAKPTPAQQRIATITAIEESNAPDQLGQLKRLFDDPAYGEHHDWLVGTMIDKAVDHPKPAHIDILRHVYRTQPAHRPRLAWAIAEIERITDFNPLFPATPAQPWFVGAIDTNPVVLYQEGYLRPGNWVNINGVSGYVEEIAASALIWRPQGAVQVLEFEPLDVLGFPNRRQGTLICYPGRPNLAEILTVIADIEGYQLNPSGIVGHLGGTFRFKNYRLFLEKIVEHSDISFEKYTIFTNRLDQFTILTSKSSISTRINSLSAFRNFFISQIGLPVDFNISDSLKNNFEQGIISQDAQWQDYLEAFQLASSYDWKEQRLKVFEAGGYHK